MEKQINFQSEDLTLEGLHHRGSSDHGVVITHPHPLYGGDMFNHVVSAVTEVYQDLGYSTLRFNFRGVGGSQGRFGDGVGEQADVAAAVACLDTHGIATVDLAGYSFGAWVNACWVGQGATVQRMVMVSPPVAFIEFTDLGDFDCLKLVVTGDRDDIAPPAMIQQHLPAWNPTARLEIIKGADHFYSGRLNQLKTILKALSIDITKNDYSDR